MRVCDNELSSWEVAASLGAFSSYILFVGATSHENIALNCAARKTKVHVLPAVCRKTIS